MEKQKQHVFSARTTEEGLKQLNKLKVKLGIGWDELVIDGMCAHYGLDKAVLSLPKKEAPAKEPEKRDEGTEATDETAPREQGKKQPAGKKKGGRKVNAEKNQQKVEMGQ